MNNMQLEKGFAINLKFLMCKHEPISKHFDIFNCGDDIAYFFEQFPYLHLTFNDDSLKLVDYDFVNMLYRDAIENFSMYEKHGAFLKARCDMASIIIESYLENYQYKNFEECKTLLDNYLDLFRLLIANNFIEYHDDEIARLTNIFQWFSIQHSYFSTDPFLYEYKFTCEDTQEIIRYFNLIKNLILEDKIHSKCIETRKNIELFYKLSDELGFKDYNSLEMQNKKYEQQLSELYKKLDFVEKQNEELKEIINKEEPKRKKISE